MLPIMLMPMASTCERPRPTPMGIAPRSSMTGIMEMMNVARYLPTSAPVMASTIKSVMFKTPFSSIRPWRWRRSPRSPRASRQRRRAACVAALGAEVDDVVRALDNVEVVLDDDTVLPASTSLSSTVSSFCTSACGGRSSARRAHTLCARWRGASSVASFTRCASPPESVVEHCPSFT